MASLPQDLKFTCSITELADTLRNDTRLTQPTLSTPTEGQRLCSDTVTLVWDQVADATHYIVQWCRNSSFSGPTLDGQKVVDSGDATTSLALDVGNDAADDLEKGNTYYWRVMAYDGAGGVSEKSDSRWFRAGCVYPRGAGGGDETEECRDYFRGSLNATRLSITVNQITDISASIVLLQGATFVSATWNVSNEDVAVTVVSQTVAPKTNVKLRLRALGVGQAMTVVVSLTVTLDTGDGNFTCETEPIVITVQSIDENVFYQGCSSVTGTEIAGCDAVCEWTWYTKGMFVTTEYQVNVDGNDTSYYLRQPVMGLPFVPAGECASADDITASCGAELVVFQVKGGMKAESCGEGGLELRPVMLFKWPFELEENSATEFLGDDYMRVQWYAEYVAGGHGIFGWVSTGHTDADLPEYELAGGSSYYIMGEMSKVEGAGAYVMKPWVQWPDGYTGDIEVYTYFHFNDETCTMFTDSVTLGFEHGLLMSVS